MAGLWNNHSAAELADLFAADGSFVHRFAVTFTGRSVISALPKALDIAHRDSLPPSHLA